MLCTSCKKEESGRFKECRSCIEWMNNVLQALKIEDKKLKKKPKASQIACTFFSNTAVLGLETRPDGRIVVNAKDLFSTAKLSGTNTGNFFSQKGQKL
jgi:hypothetical protein